MKKVHRHRGSGKRARRQARRTARFGAPDASLTGSAGMLAVGELMDRLGVVEAPDAGVGASKSRARGVSGGELVASLTQYQLLDSQVRQRGGPGPGQRVRRRSTGQGDVGSGYERASLSPEKAQRAPAGKKLR